MLREDDRRITGFIGSVPSQVQLRHREQRAFGGTTWRVLPDHRRNSLRLYLEQIEVQGSWLLFNTTANADVERVLDYLRFKSVPSHRSGRTYLLAVDPGRATRGYLQQRFKKSCPTRSPACLSRWLGYR